MRDLALTTNGILLAPLAPALKEAGLGRVTVSLDTLRRDRFIALARQDELARTLAGIDTAAREFPGFKIDTVVIRGVNDDEIVDLVAFARERGGEIRFIEYMDVGGATGWTAAQVDVARRDPRARRRRRSARSPRPSKEPSAPADRFRLPDGTPFGVIASTTAPVLPRLRPRPPHRRRRALPVPLRDARPGPARADARRRQRRGSGGAHPPAPGTARADRGAEARLGMPDRRPLIPVSSLKRDPHLEMHTRGG